MNRNVELAVKNAVEQASRTGRFSPDARALIKNLFETLHPRDWPEWLIESVAAVPDEIEFIQECLIAQEEALKRRLTRSVRSRNEVFLSILGRLGSPQGDEEVDLLFETVLHADPRMRGLALLRLGECRCEGIGRMILAGLEDPDPYVRKCAVESIFVSIGDHGANAWERVLSSERDSEVREAALICLTRSGERGREVLKRIRNSLAPREADYISRRISA